jgi:VanZ family protein
MSRPGWTSTLIYWSILLAYAALIFWLSSLGSDEIPSLFHRFWDKLLHAGSFALLAFLFLLAVNRGLRWPVPPGRLAAAVAVTLLYGLADEWHQSMVATRVASAADLLADAAGALAALPLYCWISRIAARRSDS